MTPPGMINYAVFTDSPFILIQAEEQHHARRGPPEIANMWPRTMIRFTSDSADGSRHGHVEAGEDNVVEVMADLNDAQEARRPPRTVRAADGRPRLTRRVRRWLSPGRWPAAWSCAVDAPYGQAHRRGITADRCHRHAGYQEPGGQQGLGAT